MREKVLEYIKKPTQKLRKELTTMEQDWADRQAKDSGNGDKAKDNKKSK